MIGCPRHVQARGPRRRDAERSWSNAAQLADDVAYRGAGLRAGCADAPHTAGAPCIGEDPAPTSSLPARVDPLISYSADVTVCASSTHQAQLGTGTPVQHSTIILDSGCPWNHCLHTDTRPRRMGCSPIGERGEPGCGSPRIERSQLIPHLSELRTKRPPRHPARPRLFRACRAPRASAGRWSPPNHARGRRR